MSKVVEYVGVFHVLKDNLKETWTQFWANFSSKEDPSSAASNSGDGEQDADENFRSKVKAKLRRLKEQSIRAIDSSSNDQEDYSHLTRSKSRRELMQISAAVMGIEFSYAAETAFVSPLLLNIGLRHRHMTLIWCLSPLLGFFVTPILGSLSDGCKSPLGRRRPFIILLSIGIILGLILVPNGKLIGRMLGDTYKDDDYENVKAHASEMSAHLILLGEKNNGEQEAWSNSDTSSTQTPLDYGGTNGSTTTSSSYLNSSSDSEELEESQSMLFPENEEERERLSYKFRSSKYSPTELEHGFRAWNALDHKDRDVERQAFIKHIAKKDKSRKIDQDELQKFIADATMNLDESKENNEKQVRGREEESSQLRPKRLESVTEKQAEDKKTSFDSGNEDAVKSHPWGLVFTVIGTVLLDFDADACQSPSRAYMLDVTIPEDHAKGLSTFTIMAGLGGCIGYFLGALNWENTFLGRLFGGHVRAVFTLVLFIFIGCVITTIRSFREIPMDRLWANKPGSTAGLGCGTTGPTLVAAAADGKGKSKTNPLKKNYARLEDDPDPGQTFSEDMPASENQKSYGSIQETSFNLNSTSVAQEPISSALDEAPTFREYVKTIVQLPRSLQWLCLTNFFCWMSLVCYSLYFTDFVGEAVFGGDPTAPRGSPLKEKYDEGVRFGCWGMSLYSLSCSIYSLCIEQLVNRFGARRVYIYGQLVYSVGMVLMAMARHPAGVIIFSWTAGIMYATLFTMPYLLVARYHAAETFDVDVDDLMEKPAQQVRGLGTDVAIVSSMVFLAQITQALTLGTIVTAVGSTTAIVCAAAVFASCGAVCATKVLYLDL